MFAGNVCGEIHFYVPVEAQTVSMFSNDVPAGSGGSNEHVGTSYTISWDGNGITGTRIGWTVTPTGSTNVPNHTYEGDLAWYGGPPTIDFNDVQQSIKAQYPTNSPEYVPAMNEAISRRFNEKTVHSQIQTLYLDYVVGMGCGKSTKT